MEKKRGNQVMAIAALFIAVIGLSLGFAAFSNTLTIRSSATVTPDATNFDIDFSNANVTTGLPEGSTLPYTTGGVTSIVTSPSGLTTAAGTIDNTPVGAPTLGELKVDFTEPGQYAEYTFYTMNVGELQGFLKQINFGSNSITCAVATTDANSQTIPEVERATQSLVNAACVDMSMTITVDGTASATLSNKLGTTGYQSNGTTGITGHPIATGAFHTVVLRLSYAKDTEVNSGAGNTVDGRMTVSFPNISLVYTTVTES